METFRQDIRFALRSLRGARTTTIIAVLCLALGIGANTAIFSVVRAVLLQSLPYAEPERLVRLNETGSRGIGSVSPPDVLRHEGSAPDLCRRRGVRRSGSRPR